MVAVAARVGPRRSTKSYEKYSEFAIDFWRKNP
jgi:hypothetical protein